MSRNASSRRAGAAGGRSATAASRFGAASSRPVRAGSARATRGGSTAARVGSARSTRQVGGGFRQGNAYRIHHGRYGYRGGYGYGGCGWGWGGGCGWGWGCGYPSWGCGWGWGVGIGIGVGFYVNWGWGGCCAPYYGCYPNYGMRFGYGTSYYSPAYETVIVESEPYYGPAEVCEECQNGEALPEEIIEEGPIEDAPIEDAPIDEGAGEQPLEPAVDDGTAQDDASNEMRKPHADFEPSVKDFLAGDYAGALEHLDRVVQDEPDNGEAWLAVMHANFALGRYGPSANGLAKAAALDAFPRGYRFDPRPLYPEVGRWDELIGNLDKHIEADPKDADAKVLRAYLHVALGEKKEASKLIDDVLVLRGDDETAPRLAMALLPPPPPPKGSGSGVKPPAGK